LTRTMSSTGMPSVTAYANERSAELATTSAPPCLAFIERDDDLVGIWPSNGGHHDCVNPDQLEQMKHTRSGTP
jgi:hypothetical protein